MNKHAQALGRLSKGVPRTFTAEQIAAATERLAANRYRGGRKPGATNLATRGKVKVKHPTGLHDMDGYYKTAQNLRKANVI